MIEYVVVEKPEGVWRVESVVRGEYRLTVIFYGPDAEQRARDEAWLRNNSNW